MPRSRLACPASPQRRFQLRRPAIGSARRLGVITLGVLGSFGLLAAPVSAVEATEAGGSRVDFVRDVQPILRRHCERCHGTKNQEAGLQLNRRASVLEETGVVLPGDAEASLLVSRLVDESYGDLMPLDGNPLSAREIATVRRWIEQGARWPEAVAEPRHWAYQPLRRPPVPLSEELAEPKNPIDAFVLRGLEREGWQPAPPAEPARLLRRVSLALTGLPPTPEQVEAFLADPSDEAYERAVDRLLQSQQFGERWAVPWLDLARYADSNGFQADQLRDNWAYRDWVVRALNEDMPYDRFVTEQLAGDLLPGATVDQRIATGFHRMTTCNVEAGVHPEANRVNQVVDRVNTTGTVFLGTTLECAQCHDHKYDPFTQEDYYRLFAYFNNTPLEVKNTSGVTWDFYGPTMELPLAGPAQQRRETLHQRLAELRAERERVRRSDADAFDSWLDRVRAAIRAGAGWKTIRPASFATTGGETFEILDDGAVLLSGKVPDKVEHTFAFTLDSIGAGESEATNRIDLSAESVAAIQVDALTDDSLPGGGPGRGDPERTNVVLNEVVVERVAGDSVRRVELFDPVADFSQKGWDVAGAIDGDPKSGWAFAPRFGKPHWARFRTRLAADESGPADPSQPDEQLRVRLVQNFGSGRVYGKPRVKLYVGDSILIGLDESVRQLAQAERLEPEQRQVLQQAFAENHPRLKELDRQIRRVERQLEQIEPPTTLVMVEMEQPRETYVMKRGDYENRGERVEPGTPAALPVDETIEPTGDRLELARWLTSPENPLPARVTVNRWWAELFGRGIVATPEDFGTQSEPPSHPELLDWLACELIDSGWSMKQTLKQIVLSATFRQSAHVSAEQWRRDPANRWLARGPRFRLPAELIRDNALSISGLLSSKMYGPPVMPYQPDKVWRSIGRNQPTWKTAIDEDRFRRGLYVVFKRAAPYPSFVNFDTPDRGSCTVERPRTNTPLQALTLLNDPAYAEMALAFADRILRETPGEDDAARIAHAFRLAVARSAEEAEIDLLRQLLDRERESLAGHPERVRQRMKLALPGLELASRDEAELAAWFAVANALLNLDETMSL